MTDFYRKQVLSRDDIIRMTQTAQSTWQHDLLALVSGEIDGFFIEAAPDPRETSLDVIEQQEGRKARDKRAHNVFNAIQFRLTKAAKIAGVDYRDYVSLMRQSPKVLVYRKLDSSGTPVPMPEAFVEAAKEPKMRVGSTLRRSGGHYESVAKPGGGLGVARTNQVRKAG
jgi:hypothetical protein